MLGVCVTDGGKLYWRCECTNPYLAPPINTVYDKQLPYYPPPSLLSVILDYICACDIFTQQDDHVRQANVEVKTAAIVSVKTRSQSALCILLTIM